MVVVRIKLAWICTYQHMVDVKRYLVLPILANQFLY